jgi:REP element-mobilizing transposase RayT
MPQSLARIPIHLIFSTKHREPLLHDAFRDDLHRYLSNTLKGIDCPCIKINSVDDHVHALFELGRTIAIAKVVEEVKTASSKWIKTRGEPYASFAWQAGYGAFGVSVSNIDIVRQYLENQPEHHRFVSFQDELRAFLNKHDVAFDERYVWD